MNPVLQVDVSVCQAPYAVKIGRGLLATLGEELRQLSPALSSRVLVIADAAVRQWHQAELVAQLRGQGFEVEVVEVQGGEPSKAMENVAPLLSVLARHRVDRKGAVIALGGGVVGDLAGFVAGIYLRGIALVQLPTTLLAMVDSSVGGKTGVNLPEGKNLVGVFHQPRLVLADLEFLKTLPTREFSAGMAEVIKYGLLGDRDLFDALHRDEPPELAELVRRCVAIKAEIVAADPFETTGRRATLNLGHTLGHAIEQAAGYGTLLHGEAVALGLVAAARLSELKCGLAESERFRIEETLARYLLPTRLMQGDRERILAALRLDKKVAHGRNQWVLMPQLGSTQLRDDLTPADVAVALDLLLGA